MISVLAQGAQLQNPIKFDSFDDLLLAIIDSIIILSIPLVVLVLVWTGFKFVSESSSPEKLNANKNRLIWIFVGLFLLLSAKGVIEIIKNTVESFR